ncbi:hypothetical protein BJF86_01805 [Serinicoccus sp. CNJ-927]|uniref:hypothetical protein n=1 Tax=unclassified Serinicoccus TaxID=2643101 RepID=UPI00096271C4|nr:MULTISPECIES: hypothetical protein [unclassified Serinicoccus]OLT18998.1 hypothetical protein BJF80_13135 [Serinicoccus sp. CUA-874]OLT43527.1 hypothetical protein BJF86_01805 [Serinicoccus sp. CNJ-927]
MSAFLRTAEMTMRDLVGRRWALLLLILVPLVFYGARRGDASWQGIRFACMGLAWALSTVALFSTISAKSLEPRLRLAGARVSALLAGRVLALVIVALVVGGVYAALIAADQAPENPWSITAALLLSAVISVPLGMLIARLVPRDFEGMLVLITVVGLQTIVDPESAVAKLLPLWSIRELLTHGVEGAGDLRSAAIHASVYGAALVLLSLMLAWRSLRARPHVVRHAAPA